MTEIERRKSKSTRRRHVRYGFQCDVEIEYDSKTVRTFITDIGLGGMFVVLQNAPLPLPGTKIKARLLLEEPLSLKGEARHALPGRGLGVKFAGLSEQALAQLLKLIALLMESE